jgi:beta-N-acetylglucosaminidase
MEITKIRLKGWQFLFVSGVLVFVALTLSAASEARQNELRDLRLDRDRQLERLMEIRQQLQEASDRLVELEEMLLNLQRTEQIVSGASPPRGGRQYTVTTMPILSPSGFSATRFERAFEGTPLAGIGEALVQAEAETGINALVLAGIIAHESGWGRSRLAQDKNNLAGLGAYDGQEYSAGIRFDSQTASIMFLAELLAVKYAPGGCYFGGSHDLQGIGVKYASDPGWAEKVAGCMRAIMGRAAL